MFFIIKYDGKDKNGNSRRRITGFKQLFYTNEYIPLNKSVMKSILPGRWSEKTQSIITQRSVDEIKSALNELEKPYSFALM